MVMAAMLLVLLFVGMLFGAHLGDAKMRTNQRISDMVAPNSASPRWSLLRTS
jgi:hypothetical protein